MIFSSIFRESFMSKSKSNNKSSKDAYSTVWRWHFYAGLFSAPVLIILALTGLGMLLFANIEGRHGELLYVDVANGQSTLPISSQLNAVEKTLPKANVVQYISPKEKNQVAIFRAVENDKSIMVAVNPYTAEVIKTYPKAEGTYDLMNDIHGDLLIGKKGDYIIETIASFTVLMILTGWYLWWSRQKSLKKSLFPQLRNQNTQKNTVNKQWWRNTHGATGAWTSVILFFFLISGLAWAGIWGGKMVQAWSQFPAGKWGNPPAPVSTPIHASQDKKQDKKLTHGDVLNAEGAKEVPWVLEQTPMPSSSDFTNSNEITITTINDFAHKSLPDGRFQINFPKGETGVWTISQDSMSYDSKNPMADRTIHLDQYSGKVIADIKYDDYSVFGKFMAVGIALHMGTLGLWSILANALFCLAIIFLCIAGLVMWWKRRPNKAVGLAPPPKRDTQLGFGFALLLFLTAIAFPTAIIAVIFIAVLDFILLSRFTFFTRLVK